MGIGFVAIIWMIFVLTLVGIYLILSHFARGTFLEDFAKAGMMVFVVLVIFVAGFIIITTLLDRFSPTYVFYSSSGSFPSSSIKDLKGQKSSFGDAGQASLRFKADKDTVDKIIKENSFLDRFKEAFSKSEDENLREFSTKTKAKFYQSPTMKMGFGQGGAILAYDEESENVYFYSYGID